MHSIVRKAEWKVESGEWRYNKRQSRCSISTLHF